MGDGSNVQLGKDYGCYRVVKGYEHTAQDIQKIIKELYKDTSDNSSTLNNLSRLINYKAYTCETRCGKTFWLSPQEIVNAEINKNDSFGCESCRFRVSRQADIVKRHSSCETDYTGLQFNTLKVLNKLDRVYEELSIENNPNKRLISTQYDYIDAGVTFVVQNLCLGQICLR